MFTSLFHHRGENQELFGLLEARMVLLEAVGTGDSAESQETRTRMKKEALIGEIDNLQNALDAQKQDYKEYKSMKGDIGSEIRKYNLRFANGKVTTKRPYYERLDQIDFSNPGNAVAQIDRILTTPFWHKPEGKTVGEWLMLDINNPKSRGHALWKLRNMLTRQDKMYAVDVAKTAEKAKFNLNRHGISLPNNLQDTPVEKLNEVEKALYAEILAIPQVRQYTERTRQLKILHTQIVMQMHLLKNDPPEDQPVFGDLRQKAFDAEGVVNSAYGDRTAENMRKSRADAKTYQDWTHLPAFRNMEDAFDSATSMAIIGKDKEFSEFWTVRTDYSKAKLEMTKDLFFSILAEETDGFKDDLVLGKGFGESHTENKDNFPFIYNEWLKDNGFKNEKYQALDRRVSTLEAEVKTIEQTESATEIMRNNGLTTLATRYENLNPATRNNWDSVQWDEAEGIFGTAYHELSTKRRNEDDESGEKAATADHMIAMEKYRSWAKANYDLQEASKDEKGISKRFTRSHLTRGGYYRQKLMEFSMRKFMKAMQIVDTPMTVDGRDGENPALKGNEWHHYNHAVRRAMVAHIYDQGVSDYRENTDTSGDNEYVGDISSDHYWMVSQIAQSDYFGNLSQRDELTPQHQNVLIVARIGNRVALQMEYNNAAKYVIDETIKVKKLEKEQKTADEARKKEIQVEIDAINENLRQYPSALVAKANVTKLEYLEKDKANIDPINRMYNEFLEKAEAAIKDPHSDKSKQFIKDVLSGRYEKNIAGTDWTIVKGDSVKAMQEKMQRVVEHHDVMEADGISNMDLLKRMDIRVDGGTYFAYLNEIKKNPNLSIENWDNLFHPDQKDDFDALTKMFEKIIPDSQGRKDFLKTFKTLRGKGDYAKLYSSRDDQMTAIETYEMIKQHILGSREAVRRGYEKEEEINEILRGEHFGDRAEKVIRQVTNMLTNGSLAEKGAAAIAIFGLLKMVRKAWKGDDKYGMAFRAMFVGASAEIILKKMTGRGIADRFGIDSVEGAVERTYEAVLIQDGKDHMSNLEEPISVQEHTGALYELNDVPFHKLMEWYEKETDIFGDTDNPPDIPEGINLNNIVQAKASWHKKDKNKRAAYVLRNTMLHFFEYIGKKDHEYAASGKNMLKERWVTVLDKSDSYQTRYTEFDHRKYLKEAFGGNRDRLTWRIVMQSEISPTEAANAKNLPVWSQVVDTVGDGMAEFTNWTRQSFLGTISEGGQQFFEGLGDAKDKVMDVLGEFGEARATDLYFAKNEAVFMYKQHKMKIRRFFGQHWELIKDGIKLPFEIMYAADQAIVPWASKVLKQGKATFNRHEFSTLSDNSLDADDIMPSPGERPWHQDNQAGFAHHGFFMDEYHAALEGGNTGGYRREFPASRGSGKQFEKMYYRAPDGVGYLITATNVADANISSSDDEGAKWGKMQVAAGETARQHFKNVEGMRNGDIEQFMDPTHVTKSADRNTLYTFWRMPVKGSNEFEMKERGVWTDYYDANKFKHRPIFMVDPTKTYWQNINDAMIAKGVSGETRATAGSVTKAAGQLGMLPFEAVEAAGEFAGWVVGPHVWRTIGSAGAQRWVEDLTSMNQANKQTFDLVTKSAGDANSAKSDYFRGQGPLKRARQNAYNVLTKFAHKTNVNVFYGLFDGQTGFEATWLSTEKPKDWRYWKFNEWLSSTRGVSISAAFQTVLSQKMAEEVTAGEGPGSTPGSYLRTPPVTPTPSGP